MPSPTTQPGTLRPDLKDSLMEFDLQADQDGFIALKVMPVIEVGLQSSPFGRIPIEALLKGGETLRAPGAEYSRGDWQFEMDSYSTEEHGWETPVDARQAKIYQHFFNAELIAARRSRGIVLRNLEIMAAAKIFDPVVWATMKTTLLNEWDDATNATPIADIKAAKIKVFEQCGLNANALVISQTVFWNVRECDQIIDRVKYSGHQDPRSKKLTAEALAEVFDLEYVIVAGGGKDTTAEGQASVPARIWSNEYAMLCRVATDDDIQTPCIGRIMHWAEDGSQIGTVIESYWWEPSRCERVRARCEVHEKVMYAQAGHLLENVTT